MSQVLEKLWSVIEDRKKRLPEGSYTTSLFLSGMPRMAQKVGEEAVETVVAALSQDNERVVAEMADLIYHSLVMLSARELAWSDVEVELARRFK